MGLGPGRVAAMLLKARTWPAWRITEEDKTNIDQVQARPMGFESTEQEAIPSAS